MLKSCLTTFGAIALGVASSLALALTVDEIIDKNIAARGGIEHVTALRSLRLSGKVILPGTNMDIATVRVVQRGGSVRDEFTLQGLTMVHAYDGKQAWKIDPFQGRKDPEQMSADEAKSLLLEGDIDLPLVDYRAKGYTSEYLGLEDVDGSPAHKLRLRKASGDEVVYYIDPDTSMVIREVQKLIVRGAEQEIETDYGEYEQVADVFIPMTEQSGPKGSDASQKQQVVFEKAEANVSPAAGYFSFPVAKQP